MTVPVFEVCDVTYSYHEVTALDGLNLTDHAGAKDRSAGSERFRQVNSAQYA